MTSDESGGRLDPHSALDRLPSEIFVKSEPVAWQPLTPRGVAAFARAPFSRLFLVEFIVALLAAGTFLWFLAVAWFPTAREAIHRLPDQGQIRGRELRFPRTSSDALAAGPFLAFGINLENRGTVSGFSHIRVEFHRSNFEICSLAGCLVFDYPEGWVIEFNRTELEPWWGAWEPIILSLVALLTILSLLLTWLLLATGWFTLARLLAFVGDRALTWRGSWKLSSAALMPGALLFIAAIWMYGLQALDFILLGIVFLLHFVLGLVYVCMSTLALPRVAAGERALARNPFTAPPPAEKGTDQLKNNQRPD